MYSITLVTSAVLLAGAANAFTPPGFEPSSTSNLTVAFGDLLAIDGVNLPKASTQVAPIVGTAEKLFGSYSLLMVDPDIPPQNPGEPTRQFLHWLQTGLVSADTSSTVAGQEIFQLVNPTNTTAIASYYPPAPPARSPFSHRYIQLLVNTTGNDAALGVLAAAGAVQLPFSAQDVVTAAGLTVLAGNWFNVTNTSTPVTPSGTGASPTPTVPFTGGANLFGPSAVVAGLGALIVLVL